MDVDGPGPTLTHGYRTAPGKAAGRRAAAAASPDRLWKNLIACDEGSGDGDGASSAPVRYLTAREAGRMQGFPESFFIPSEADPAGPGVALFGNATSVQSISVLKWRGNTRSRLGRQIRLRAGDVDLENLTLDLAATAPSA